MALNDSPDGTSPPGGLPSAPLAAASPAPSPGGTTQLGCGRDIDDIWETVDLPPDVHEQTCPDCQAARASLRGLADATRELGTTDAGDPTLQAGAAITDAVVSIARAEVRRGRRLPLNQPLPGQTEPSLLVSEQTIAGVIRFVGDQIAGLETRRCRIEVAEPSSDAPAAPGGPTSVVVHIRVSVAARLSIPDVVEVLRVRTVAALEQEIGLRAVAVDVEVEDLHDAA